jgi:hypothetical protein
VAALRSALARLDRGRARSGGLNPLGPAQFQLQHHRQHQHALVGEVAAAVAGVLVEACLCLTALAHANPSPASSQGSSACGPAPPSLAKDAAELARLLAPACPPQPQLAAASSYGGGGQGVHWTAALRLALAALAASRRPDARLVGDALAPLVGGWPPPPAAAARPHEHCWAALFCGPPPATRARPPSAGDAASVEALSQHANKRRRDVAATARATAAARRPRTATWAPPGSTGSGSASSGGSGSALGWGAPAPRGGAFEVGLGAGQGVASASFDGRTLKVTFEYDLGGPAAAHAQKATAPPFPEGAFAVALQGVRGDGAGGATARLLLS